MGGKITVNGHPYDSPEAMPPDVRRTYEEALRAIGPPAGGETGETTRVITGPAGFGVTTNMVVRKKITVNDRTYGSVDEMPPDVRRVFEGALEQAPKAGGITHAQPTLRLSVNVGPPKVRTFVESGGGPPEPGASTEPRLRALITLVGFLILGGLAVWAFLGR